MMSARSLCRAVAAAALPALPSLPRGPGRRLGPAASPQPSGGRRPALVLGETGLRRALTNSSPVCCAAAIPSSPRDA